VTAIISGIFRRLRGDHLVVDKFGFSYKIQEVQALFGALEKKPTQINPLQPVQ
jgi:hypothetical protein